MKRTTKTKNADLGRLSVEQFKQAEKLPVIVVLDNIRSMHNVGAAFRTADAFRIEKIYLCGITARPPHREIHKTALGATESVAWEYVSDISTLVSRLKKEKVTIVAIEQADPHIPLQHFSPVSGAKYAFVFGNEVQGVSDQMIDASDFCLEIPQQGTKHSLNISVSLGIVLWDAFRKLHLTED